MKKMTMKFMALALLMVASTAALYAQGVAFTSTSLPRNVRQDGITETAGEVVLASLTIGGQIQDESTIDLIYSVAITNNAPNANPAINNQISIGNNITCVGAGFAVVNPPSNCPANLNAALQGSNTVRIRYTDSIVSPPLPALAIPAGSQIIISRVRVNANAAVGVGSVTVTMSGISSSPATDPISFTDPQRQVGVLNAAITARFGSGLVFDSALPAFLALQTCNFPNVPINPADQAFVIRIDEVFPGALTTIAQETTFSAFQPPTNGVVLRIILLNVPAGLTVTPQALGAGSTVTLGLTIPGGQDQITAGAAMTFDYPVTASDLAALERAHIPFKIKPTSTSTNATLALASIGSPVNVQATVSITPISATETIIPRFVANQIGPTTVASIADCNTRILMTWVATVADVETGIAISNTSSDDAAFGSGTLLGATSQNGTCTLTGYPTAGGTPVSFTTATINAGASLPFLLSATTGFANFTGYVLTVCNFQAAHAFVFITNGRGVVTGPTLAQGYVANVIQGGPRPGGLGPFESLGN